MAFAGGVGVEINLDDARSPALSKSQASYPAAIALFSESNTRFLVEVSASHAGQLEAVFGNLPIGRIGTTTTTQSFSVINQGVKLVDGSLTELKSAWQSPLDM